MRDVHCVQFRELYYPVTGIVFVNAALNFRSVKNYEYVNMSLDQLRNIWERIHNTCACHTILHLLP